jgi:paraquat-inducible protein B
MSKKISPTLIGAFVLGALALVVVAVVALGSGRFFRQTREFVLYFDSSVNGLRVGAPVKFKGVEIGAVKDIRLQLEKGAQVNKIPVIIEIDLEKLTSRGATTEVARDLPTFHKAIVEMGLRGQLLMESLVTGLLYIGLDLFPNSPVRLVQTAGGKYQYPEIPTTPTTLEQAQDAATRIMAKIEELDFKGLTKSLTETVDGINQLVNSPDLKASLRALQQTMPKVDEALLSMRNAATSMDQGVVSLSKSFEQTSEATREAMQQAVIALKQTDGALKAAETVMVSVNGVMDQDSPMFYEFRRSMKEISAAARTVRLLGGYIERNPRSLIFGKPESVDGQ